MSKYQYIFDYCRDWVFVIFYILLGISAKFGYLSQKKKLTKKDGFIAFAFGIFGGFMANLLPVENKQLHWALISICSLTGENIVSWLILNSKDILTKILNLLTKKKE